MNIDLDLLEAIGVYRAIVNELTSLSLELEGQSHEAAEATMRHLDALDIASGKFVTAIERHEEKAYVRVRPLLLTAAEAEADAEERVGV